MVGFAEHGEGVDAGFVAVGEMEIEGVAADDGDVVEVDVFGN